MADEVEREPTFVLAIAVLANLGLAASRDPGQAARAALRPTFILVMPRHDCG
jgi:hypothetical protein